MTFTPEQKKRLEKKGFPFEDFQTLLTSFYEAQVKILDNMETMKLEQKTFSDNISYLSTTVSSMHSKLDPMYQIYDTTLKFGRVAKFIGKFIIAPTIFLIGAALTIKNLFR